MHSSRWQDEASHDSSPSKHAMGRRCLGRSDEPESIGCLLVKAIRDKQPISTPPKAPGGSQRPISQHQTSTQRLFHTADPAASNEGRSRWPQSGCCLTTGSLVQTWRSRVWDRLGQFPRTHWRRRLFSPEVGPRRGEEREWRPKHGTCGGRQQKHATRHAGSLRQRGVMARGRLEILSLFSLDFAIVCSCFTAYWLIVMSLAGPL